MGTAAEPQSCTRAIDILPTPSVQRTPQLCGNGGNAQGHRHILLAANRLHCYAATIDNLASDNY
ncbi:hypothetical protein M404DRAFT_1005718 [Pisolithus tinctorius Marx 270]|uniref:Uncharacterized protein n=1 Tax=Pisolithus tinctorius Marx 270 TaxID=870435 RepID=A0A0C3IM29_PISTI|nr:hypothetical protein M404DRAFT_1005718 [Pisolithus tinctorius Marx 270]